MTNLKGGRKELFDFVNDFRFDSMRNKSKKKKGAKKSFIDKTANTIRKTSTKIVKMVGLNKLGRMVGVNKLLKKSKGISNKIIKRSKKIPKKLFKTSKKMLKKTTKVATNFTKKSTKLLIKQRPRPKRSKKKK
jgi:hypothetical protein